MYIFLDYFSNDIQALSISLIHYLHNNLNGISVMHKHKSMQVSEVLISKLKRKANYFNSAEIQLMAKSINEFLNSLESNDVLENDDIIEFVELTYGSIHDLYFRVYRLNDYFEEILHDQYCRSKIYAS